MSSYDAVVLDNDGGLTRPTDRGLIERGIRAAFREFGVIPPPPDGIDALNTSDPDAIAAAAGTRGLDPAALWRRREANVSRVQREAIRAGDKPAYDDVAALEGLDVPLGVVSNNQHATVEYVVAFFGIPAAATVGREPTLEGLERLKPNPHYLERAIAELGIENPLYVGDSDVDVAAAAALGLDAAFVRRPHREGYDLDREPAYEIRSLDALPALLDHELA